MKDKTKRTPHQSVQIRAHARPTQRALGLTDFFEPDTDPSGSYTGRPVEAYEKPVQDADDL